MLCDNCHSSNAAGAKFCAVCGAPLPGEPLTHRQGQGESRQPQQHYSYEDGFNSTRRPPERRQAVPAAQQPYRSRYAPRDAYAPAYQRPQRSIGAIIFYMLNGLLALACLSTVVLPSVDYLAGRAVSENYANRYMSVIDHIVRQFDVAGPFYRGEDGSLTGAILVVMFAVPTVFILLWAIFSFARVSAAGGMGLVGSIFLTNISAVWLLYLRDYIRLGTLYFKDGNGGTLPYLTAVPFLMILFGFVGIIFSSVQLSQRNRVR